jgi:hypothetical protein
MYPDFVNTERKLPALRTGGWRVYKDGETFYYVAHENTLLSLAEM